VRPFYLFVMIFGALFACSPAWADETPEPTYESAEGFLNSLTFKKGLVELGNGLATLDVPENFRYIGPKDSQRFLEEGWGNPDGSGQIGMLLPMDTDLFGDAGWAVVISYQEDGYVSDKDAGKMDYNELLESMQASARESNKQRSEKGYPPITLIGWAASPHYDSQAKKLYWAKELQFGREANHTLNYNVRILGRKGVLVMNAVSAMDQLPLVQERMEQVLAFSDFNEGYRYSEFDSGVDKVAAYGVAALIGGKLALKVGLLAKLGGLLVAFKKVIIVALLAMGGLFKKIFSRRRADESPA
jgi:uncharacterized membrane-anchored protein